ncbi:efflux RND transporter periplasmic adaptor subunit [Pelomonas aquatica]|jgi:multidrug efflux system membrane fusion protein|uniref:Efflux RND transporter periplasmic adaptor subunit n=1 Tax=Pelomonas aquatica TaxID=431058 RepID=A0A9X4LF31_9BURK|nr:efflux RND transporter periplasmic adaptor subunit [Pelomonas aquatica]MCY4755491.1 efflux RND transporter periplasmic adaptor subunit [Pelomonas aquatica]MDG0862295.1 efflux RND transporter periplasmic adaptor subunit [Pelomonas aquatica]
MPQLLRLASPLLLAALLSACGKQPAAPEPERAVRTQLVTAGTASASHEYAAEVKPRIESRLSFRVGGKLLSRAVNLGDAVKAGQLLARIDGQDLRLAEAAASAAVAAARTNRDQAGQDYKRFVDLQRQGFISTAELERRDSAFKAAQAQLEQAKAQADVQGNQAGYAQLLADGAGVVTGIDAEPGQVLAAGTPVVRVALDGPRDIVFAVPEDQIARVRAAAGRPAALKVRLWGSDKTAPLTLREVAAAADPATRTFLIKADAGRLDVRLGQSATAVLDLPQVAGIIKLPLAAVMQQAGKTSVWVLDGASMTVRPVAVQVGGAEGNEVVIAGGLNPGQEVVVAGAHVLNPGQKVKRYVPPRTTAAAAPAAPAASR